MFVRITIITAFVTFPLIKWNFHHAHPLVFAVFQDILYRRSIVFIRFCYVDKALQKFAPVIIQRTYDHQFSLGHHGTMDVKIVANVFYLLV